MTALIFNVEITQDMYYHFSTFKKNFNFSLLFFSFFSRQIHFVFVLL